MAANAVTQKKLVHSVTVRVPTQTHSSSSSSSASRRSACSRGSGCCSVRNRIHYPSNFKRSAAPARVMFFQNGSWNDLPDHAIEILRSGFVERKAVVSVEIEGSTFLFDFMRMLQIDSGTGAQRSIAWIDENGKCFFPVAFVCEDLKDGSDSLDSPNRSIDNRVVVPGRVLGKRKTDEVDEDEVTSSIRQRIVDKSSPWPNMKLLKEGEKPYAVGSQVFLAGMRRVDPAAAVTSIHQCVRTGPLDRARYEVFQKQVEITKVARGVANVVHAWYGASASEIRGILTHGFGGPSKVSGPQSRGVGLYLSHLSAPHLSAGRSDPDDNGEKHAILCRVILGNVEKVEAGSQQCHPSSAEFDTGVDDLRNPKWYVVWSTNMNRHVLPDCVVSYRSSVRVPAQMGRLCSIDALVSRVQKYLTPSKVEELSSLVCDLKVGKLAKSDFVKQFRSVTGDQLKPSVIRELRG
ncbi:probable inactive poly [ADP-ribose] polymerase SRO3 [Prunus avium]|uniref:Probable inactive poly [ADP-ribose] polymerase SRO3 n=1 Tax=Prunus avium TaxID=42229 RepID=A0A6P5TWH2_PRUAV|nr:probable inactive poly [ADP-ribose] polymerase SRO3 [Prunus avium]